MDDISIEILEILRHYFKLGLKTIKAVHRISEVKKTTKISVSQIYANFANIYFWCLCCYIVMELPRDFGSCL